MSQYKQVGNAVPVNLAYEVATQIHKALEEYENGMDDRFYKEG